MTKSLAKQLIDRHDLVGKTFGKWTITKYEGAGRYTAQCACGHIASKQGAEMTHMRSLQCFHCRFKERKANEKVGFRYKVREEQ